ncbi:MAG: dihydrofolate reductase family protein [Tannerella sp.]|jgi:dihydrofolate reductase|nr:dihydrofolate reductase family protein [Tannerella sp.]
MKEIKIFIAVSLDGFIAFPDGGMDWLAGLSCPTLNEFRDKTFYDSIDTVIMGNGAYLEIASFDVDWPYKDKMAYVLSRRNDNLPPKATVSYLTENVLERIRQIKCQEGKDIWLLGGGQTIRLLLNHDLVDELQLCYIPVMMGEGIPLFPCKMKTSKWELTGSTVYDSSVLKVDYKRANR